MRICSVSKENLLEFGVVGGSAGGDVACAYRVSPAWRYQGCFEGSLTCVLFSHRPTTLCSQNEELRVCPFIATKRNIKELGRNRARIARANYSGRSYSSPHELPSLLRFPSSSPSTHAACRLNHQVIETRSQLQDYTYLIINLTVHKCDFECHARLTTFRGNKPVSL